MNKSEKEGIAKMKKNAIIYGSLSGSGIIENAVRRLSEIILDYTGEYPVCLPDDTAESAREARRIYIGTVGTNPHVAAHSSKLTKAEEYAITVSEDSVVIEGFDESGVLYGCIDFYDKYLSRIEWTGSSDPYIKNPFEAERLPDFALTASPSVKQRGLWTWGHVIYDWRGYINNMMLLKMNTLRMWNDFVPFNAREIIDYAHRAGIKIYFGFPWGWGTDCRKIDLESLDALSDSVAEYYENNYASIGCDGIYFQSFTELSVDNIGGVLIADAVTSFVNKTAAKILEKHPSLELQFGLHASSVKERLEYIARTDKRIKIVWEDCGAFPYNYLPNAVGDFDETLAFTEKICRLRGEDESFGAVLKGLTKLDWKAFEHPTGAYYIGVCSERKARERTERKKDIWRFLEAYWLANADYANRMIKAIDKATGGNCCLTALVEDGMFERNIHYPVALFAEMLWNANAETGELISSVALRDYITFEM